MLVITYLLQIEKSGSDSALEGSYLKRTAFSQYFSLVKDMREYEKEHFDKYLKNATQVVNSVTKSNILKLEFSHQVVTRDETSRRASSPTLLPLSRSKFKRVAGLGSAMAGSSKRNNQFQRMAHLVGWMAGGRARQNQHLAFAEKVLEATKTMANLKAAESTEFGIQQAKCKFQRNACRRSNLIFMY